MRSHSRPCCASPLQVNKGENDAPIDLPPEVGLLEALRGIPQPERKRPFDVATKEASQQIEALLGNMQVRNAILLFL